MSIKSLIICKSENVYIYIQYIRTNEKMVLVLDRHNFLLKQKIEVDENWVNPLLIVIFFHIKAKW